jgi:dTMP kinase
MSRTRGRLIVLEGIDGSGKSTLADGLARGWRSAGRPVALWHEPSDPELGARAAKVGRSNPWASALIFTLDRAVARPKLERLLARSDVIADRSFYSTLAYQGSLLGAPERRRLETLQRAVAAPPDVILLLDLRPETGLQRVGRRGKDRSAFERLATLRRVSRAYRGFARKEGWLVLDAAQTPAELLADAERGLSSPRRRRAERRV